MTLLSISRKLKEIKRISFFTNGSLLDKVGIKKILKSGVSTISVSTPGFDEFSYKNVYKIDDYRKVFNNIYNLVKLNHELDHNVRIVKGFYRGNFPQICRNCREYKSLKTWFRLSRTKELSKENIKQFQESKNQNFIKDVANVPFNQ